MERELAYKRLTISGEDNIIVALRIKFTEFSNNKKSRPPRILSGNVT